MYNGYVYLWYDTITKWFYVGGHYGQVEDRYVCSNRPMKAAYLKRRETFRFRVLQYVLGSTEDLRLAEQRWLNMIQDKELMNTNNLKSNTIRYYNVKKNSAGGNGSANRGNSNIGGRNRGIPMSEEQKRKIALAHKGKKQTKEHVQNRVLSMRKSRPVLFRGGAHTQ